MAIDGKTVRRSYDRSRSRQAIHLVSAWASANTMTLGQVKTEEKSNEITAIPRLLELLDLHGCIVTIDAMGCQREIAEQIVDAGADYMLAVKDNQGRLYDDVRDLFQGAEEFGFEGVPHDHARTLNKGHGRIETRECWAVTDPECLDYLQTWKQWSGLKAVVKITARRGHGPVPLLHQQPGRPGREVAFGRSQPLEHREFTALDLGRDLPRRPMPGPQVPRTTKPGHDAANFPQPA